MAQTDLELQEAIRQVKELLKVSKELGNALKNIVPKEREQLIKIDPKTSKSVSELTDKVKELEESLKQRRSGLTEEQKLQAKLDKLRKGELDQTIKLRTAINEETKAIKANNKSLLETTTAYKKLTAQTNKAQLEFKELAVQFGINSKQAKNALINFNRLDKSLRAINNTARDGRRDVGRYGIATKGLGKNLASLGTNLVGSLGVIGGIQLFTQVLTESVKVIKEFEFEQSRLSAVLGKSKEDIAELTELTKELGATTQFTASQATQGAIALAQAGFSTTQIIQGLGATLELATAGNIELAEAADIASNVLSGFGLKASETQRVVDVLAKSASSANVTIPSLGESFKEIASTAALVGVEIEEVGAAINALGNAGIKGTKATNTLQSSFLRLAHPPKEAQKAINKLNLELFDQEGKFIGLTGYSRTA